MEPLGWANHVAMANQERSDGHLEREEGSPPGEKRKRAKQACEPCRLRKRRCDGALPCNMCMQFDYKCIPLHCTP